MNKRNTRQKEIILECIRKDDSHPNISKIMKRVNEKDANIGQATVYRNINKLLDEGLIEKLYGSLDEFCYDGSLIEHDHLICMKCGRIIDLFDNDYTSKKKTIAKKYSFKVEKASTTYKGICIDCQNNLEKR